MHKIVLSWNAWFPYVQCSNWIVATLTSNIQNILFIRFGCKLDFCLLLVAACMDTKFVNIYWQHRNPFSKTNLVLLRLVSISRCTVPVPTALTICPSPRLTSLGLASFLNSVKALSSSTYGRTLQNLSPMLVLVGDYHVFQRYKLIFLDCAWCHFSWCGRWTIIMFLCGVRFGQSRVICSMSLQII